MKNITKIKVPITNVSVALIYNDETSKITNKKKKERMVGGEPDLI